MKRSLWLIINFSLLALTTLMSATPSLATLDCGLARDLQGLAPAQDSALVTKFHHAPGVKASHRALTHQVMTLAETVRKDPRMANTLTLLDAYRTTNDLLVRHGLVSQLSQGKSQLSEVFERVAGMKPTKVSVSEEEGLLVAHGDQALVAPDLGGPLYLVSCKSVSVENSEAPYCVWRAATGVGTKGLELGEAFESPLPGRSSDYPTLVDSSGFEAIQGMLEACESSRTRSPASAGKAQSAKIGSKDRGVDKWAPLQQGI